MATHHVWDEGGIRFGAEEPVIGEGLFGAILRYDLGVPERSHLQGCGPADVGKQRLLVGKNETLKLDEPRNNAGQWDKARLQSLAAPHAGAWLDAPPSRALDFRLSNTEVCSRVGRRLGAQLCEEEPCPFCWGVVDRRGVRAECCMAGGNKTAEHNCVRGNVYAQRKFWRPVAFCVCWEARFGWGC